MTVLDSPSAILRRIIQDKEREITALKIDVAVVKDLLARTIRILSRKDLKTEKWLKKRLR